MRPHPDASPRTALRIRRRLRAALRLLPLAVLPAVMLAALPMLSAMFPIPPGIARVWGAEPPTAAELMRRMDELWRGDASHARMTMQVRTRNYTRSMTLESWSRGKEHSLIRILSPKKDEGIATLKVSDNIWNYLPNINRVTKVPASMMGGAWMGSHFTNDDLV
ncbi:MAG: outer membrane lipoprotein-sorting protein, partial [Deltaproteobacteria bacterium]|nr:outer membrane lipoprotein-sorting protein [Deltaproteobacteria bacterium]